MTRLASETSTTVIAASDDANRAPLSTTRTRLHPDSPRIVAIRVAPPEKQRKQSRDGRTAACWRGTAENPYLALRCQRPIWMHLPGTRRFCSEQGRSPQGDRLFRPSAVKRNLRRPRRATAAARKRWACWAIAAPSPAMTDDGRKGASYSRRRRDGCEKGHRDAFHHQTTCAK